MKLLAADVGFGTTDILVYDSEKTIENCYRLVVPSRTRELAAKIREATAAGTAVVMKGATMGGGPVGRALKAHLEAGLPYMATPEAALTFNDDLEQVRSWGVVIETEPAAAAPGDAVVIASGDLDLASLLPALSGLGIDTDFDGAAIAVQDHGFAPGESNRKYRFARWREQLSRDRSLDSLAYAGGEIPGPFTRMAAAAALLEKVGPVVAMDTGPAAVRGAASVDLQVSNAFTGVVVNCGNGHTLAAIIRAGGVQGLVEHHTGLLDTDSFTRIISGFTAGTLTDEDVFGEGGHGCMPPEQPFPLSGDAPLIVTGPQRDRFRDAALPMTYAAPYGDMMMTGCFGLVGAWLRIAAGPSA